MAWSLVLDKVISLLEGAAHKAIALDLPGMEGTKLQ